MGIRYIIYDGECGFCNKAMMFIAKRDVMDRFVFVSNLSGLGISLMAKYCLQEISRKSIILIHHDKYFVRSAALQKIFMQLPRWRLVGVLLKFIPKLIKDFIYDIVSHNRRKMYKNSKCIVPNPSIKQKFL